MVRNKRRATFWVQLRTREKSWILADFKVRDPKFSKKSQIKNTGSILETFKVIKKIKNFPK